MRVITGLFARSLALLAAGVGMLLFVSGSGPALAQEPPLVLAFYYAWYDAKTWESGLVADQPALPYVSSDRASIERHVSQAQAAGIDALIQSWYGPQEANNQTEANFRTLLEVAAARGFQAAVDFETTGPFFPDRASVVEGLRYLLAVHAGHPAYLRYPGPGSAAGAGQGKPVIFFWRQDRFSVDEWAAIRAEVDPDRESLWIAEGVDIDYQAVFDGHHLYSIAWSPDAGRTLDDWGFRVRRYASEKGVSRLWVATVMPGYDDTRTDRGDAFAVDRRGGDYYRETWAAAVASQPDWIVITSFNEWVEGTMIEPSQSYGDRYLDLTRDLAVAFKAEGQAAGAEGEETETVEAEPESELPVEPRVRAEEAVRVRTGPGTDYPRLGRLSPGETAPVVGRNRDGSWWQIEFAGADGGLGWVTAEFVVLVGDGETLPVIPEVAESVTPTPSRAPTPSVTRKPSPTNVRAAAASRTPVPTPTATASPSPAPTPAAIPSVTSTPTTRLEATGTPLLRPLPGAKQDAPESLLWISIGSLLGALGLLGVLWRAMHRS